MTLQGPCSAGNNSGPDLSHSQAASEQSEKWQKTFENPITKPPTTDLPTPIPLRTLTTLMNYERCVSDPRFRGAQLLHSTFADPSLIDKMDPGMRQQIRENKPASVEQVYLHAFRPDCRETGNPSKYDVICPDADRIVHALTLSQRELIYHESRDHDGCYKAITLFQLFFDLCPEGQQISVQIRKETPVLLSPFERIILEFEVKGPKLLTISSGIRTQDGEAGTVVTGFGQESLHSVLGFSRPGSGAVDYVIDPSRMQWGEAGRGKFGEPYYLGGVDGFYEIMNNVCEGIEEIGQGATHVGVSEHTTLMEACAKRVLERWNDRDNAGWCDYCGAGSAERPLLSCKGCQKIRVRYCGKDHQQAGWQLHKFTCEKAKK